MLQSIIDERAVISGIIQYGSTVWIDCKELLNDDCFASHENQLIYTCLERIFEKNAGAAVDLAGILSAANEIGLREVSEHTKYLKGLFEFHVEAPNVREFARKIRRLAEYRSLLASLDATANTLKQLTGNEPISEAVAIAEKPIFDLTNKLIGGDNQIKLFGEGICEYVEELINNPKENNGIPCTFDRWTNAIGGVCAGVHLISARSGVGKSMHALNIALNVSAKYKIPVAYLDSELFLRGGNYDRALARVSGVDFTKINKGCLNEQEQSKVRKAANLIKKIPLDFLSIANMDFDSVISLVRKWIYQKTERNFKGNFANCLLVYDYIKLTDYADLKHAREYEILANRMSQLHGLTVEFKLPVIAYVQQNKELQVSQSDRLVWFASSVSALSKKQPEEIAEGMLGNRKMTIEKSRWGEGLSESNFINYNLNGKLATFTELETAEEFRTKEKERKECVSDEDA